MTVTPSDLIATTNTPTRDQLWALQYLFACNWSSGCKLSCSFSTDIVKSKTDAEQRWGLVSIPYRTLTAKLLARGSDNVAQIRNLIARASMSRWLVPLYTDESIMTGDPQPLQTYLIPTTDKRFFVGARIAVVKFNDDKSKVVKLQVSKITVLFDGAINIEDVVDSDFVAGDSIFPLIEAELSLDQEIEAITDNVLDFSLSAVESIGNYSLDTFVPVGSVSVGMETHEGQIILNPNIDFGKNVQVGITRTGSYSQIGRGKSLQVFGDRPKWKYEFNFTELSRTDSINLVRFFEAVAGRLGSFWVVSPVHDMVVVSVAPTSLIVSRHGPLNDWDLYTHIAIQKTDGSVLIKEIQSVINTGNDDQINVTNMGGATPSLEQIVRCSFAHLCRLDSDEMDEDWETDKVMSTSFSCLETIDDSDLNLGIEDLFTPTPPPPPPPDPIPPQTRYLGLGFNSGPIHNSRTYVRKDRPYNTFISEEVNDDYAEEQGVYPYPARIGIYKPYGTGSQSPFRRNRILMLRHPGFSQVNSLVPDFDSVTVALYWNLNIVTSTNFTKLKIYFHLGTFNEDFDETGLNYYGGGPPIIDSANLDESRLLLEIPHASLYPSSPGLFGMQAHFLNASVFNTFRGEPFGLLWVTEQEASGIPVPTSNPPYSSFVKVSPFSDGALVEDDSQPTLQEPYAKLIFNPVQP